MISIELRKIALEFFAPQGRRAVFQDLDATITLHRGEVLGLMGESGSGKSTLLRLIAGVIEPTRGKVTVSGVGKGEMAYLPQGGVLLEHLSIEDNLSLFSRLKATRSRFSRERLDVAVRALDIERIVAERRPVQNLSGGERQRVSLARLLSVDPMLVLLDEPCVAIGGDHRIEFLAALKRSAHELGFAIVLASHEWQEHMLIANKVGFLQQANGAGLRELRVQSVRQFSEAPWHQEAVSYTSTVPVNWVDGERMDAGTWRLSAGGHELVSAVLNPDPHVSRIVLACCPDAFARLELGTTPFTASGASDAYGFISAGEKVLVVRPDVAMQTGQVKVQGGVQAFSAEDGTYVGASTAS